MSSETQQKRDRNGSLENRGWNGLNGRALGIGASPGVWIASGLVPSFSP